MSASAKHLGIPLLSNGQAEALAFLRRRLPEPVWRHLEDEAPEQLLDLALRTAEWARVRARDNGMKRLLEVRGHWPRAWICLARRISSLWRPDVGRRDAWNEALGVGRHLGIAEADIRIVWDTVADIARGSL